MDEPRCDGLCGKCGGSCWASAPDADALIAGLDKKYGANAWYFYRVALGHWCIRLPDNEVLTADSLQVALAKAVAFVSLPKIPRRPKVAPDFEFWKITKSGGRWFISLKGQGRGPISKTKKAAEAWVRYYIEHSRKLVSRWDEQYGAMVAAGTEGITFRYSWD